MSVRISSKNDFKVRVENLVAQIPKGRVMTYGQIAVLCGSPRSARIVGGIAHFGNPEIPWQRVVMKNGGLARGFPGGLEGHKLVLEADSVEVLPDYTVDIDKLIWAPSTGITNI